MFYNTKLNCTISYKGHVGDIINSICTALNRAPYKILSKFGVAKTSSIANFCRQKKLS